LDQRGHVSRVRCGIARGVGYGSAARTLRVAAWRKALLQ